MRKGSLYFGAGDEFRGLRRRLQNIHRQRWVKSFALNAPSRAHLAQQTSLRKNFKCP